MNSRHDHPTQHERALAGLPYGAGYEDRDTVKAVVKARLLLERYNASSIARPDERIDILRKLIGALGDDGCYIEPPFWCDFGRNIALGRRFYANSGCVLLDCARIDIGDDVFLGPQVGMYTPCHPIDAAARNERIEYAKPITVGDNVWIGGHTTVCPGVTIGADTVIGAGSVVTRDIPSHVVAVGNPCRVLRPITDADRAHWQTEAKRYFTAMRDEGRARHEYALTPALAAELAAELKQEGQL